MDVIRQLDLCDLSQVHSTKRLWDGTFIDLVPGKYLVLIQHPVTTEYEKNLSHIQETIAALEELRLPVVWIMPNMDAGSDGINKGIRIFREHESPDSTLLRAFPLSIMRFAKECCLHSGYSSSGIRESAFLNAMCQYWIKAAW